jgi:hypothetical protein
MNSSLLALFSFGLASAIACTPSRQPPAHDRGVATFAPSPPHVACAKTDPVCPSGTTCIAYRNYGGVEEHACDIPCGAGRVCPQEYACTDYDDGPENVCRPLQR